MIRPLSIVLLILTSLQLNAVHLSKDGTGQVLLFPYYTVNGGQDTLINLVNTTDETKALRVRFREAANSREVFAFNVYLGAHDVWTGGVVNGDDDIPQIVSFDQSCAFPNMSYSSNTKFYDDKFTGDFSDYYSDYSFRRNEGFIEVFEMGVMTGASAEAAIIEDGMASDCSALENAWNPEGYWSENPETDMLPPTGGISGNVILINVGEGYSISQEPTAFENFSDVILNFNIDNDSPSLADSSLNAQIEQDGVLFDTHWPTGYQAISALLMKSSISNEFVTTDSIGADTDWIVTMPTRQYHIDSRYAQSDTPVAPFVDDNFSCEEYSKAHWNRDSQAPHAYIPVGIGVLPPTNNPPPKKLCFSANNIIFYDGDRNLSSGSFGIFSSHFPTGFNSLTYDETGVVIETFHDSENLTYFDSGWMNMYFGHSVEHVENNQSLILQGLPVIGFAAQRYTRDFASGGVLAQYEGIFAHKYTSVIFHDVPPEENKAMHIAHDNKGQVYLFPYYTVKNGLNTLISVVNTTNEAKALKIRFSEGKNSRDVLSFNIYLSAYDVWSAGLVPTQSTLDGHIDEPSVKLVTFDNSCTVPEINVQEFLPYSYTGSFEDGLGVNMNRTQEGSIEIFEMGTLGAAADIASANHNSSGETNCSRLFTNWAQPSGKWVLDPNDDMFAPTGGFYASVSLIDVAQGVDMTYDATAIVNFTTEANHTLPGDIGPNLSTGNNTKTRIRTEQGIVETTWDSPIDAVSALFMQSELTNDYIVNNAIQADTEWVNSYPTKQFYVDPLFTNSEQALNPFRQPLETYYGSCEPHTFIAYNREQADNSHEHGTVIIDPLPPNYSIFPEECWSVNVSYASNGGHRNNIFNSSLTLNDHLNHPMYSSISFLPYGEGWMKRLYDTEEHSKLVGRGANNEVHEIYGKPVLGFVATKLVNNYAAPGVLANYAFIQRNKGKRKITITTQQ